MLIMRSDILLELVANAMSSKACSIEARYFIVGYFYGMEVNKYKIVENYAL
jgi:hypothetical protein